MPDPIKPTAATINVIDLFNGMTLPTPCDPATQLFLTIKCVGGAWQLLLIDSEELASYIGVDSSRPGRGAKPPCGDCPPSGV